jgi:hypothetical protein
VNARSSGSDGEIAIPTSPGMEINVTPDKEAPIIPNATTNQGDCLLPVKNVSLLEFFEVSQEMKTSTAKYPAIIVKTNVGFILSKSSAKVGDFFYIFVENHGNEFSISGR